jgi:hypothetical protein
MPTLEVRVRRFSIVSQRSFEEVVSRLTETIGQPDVRAFHNAVAAAKTVVDLEKVVGAAIGASELMELIRVRYRRRSEQRARRTTTQDSSPRRGESGHHEANGRDRSRRGLLRAGDNSCGRARRWRSPVLRLDGEPPRSLRQSGSSHGRQRTRREDREPAQGRCAVTEDGISGRTAATGIVFKFR